AGAVGAEQGENFALVDVEVDIPQGLEARGIGFAQSADANGGGLYRPAVGRRVIHGVLTVLSGGNGPQTVPQGKGSPGRGITGNRQTLAGRRQTGAGIVGYLGVIKGVDIRVYGFNG